VAQFDKRLAQIEAKMDRNEQAIKRALALIASRIEKDSG
jgi:hypothetical protein